MTTALLTQAAILSVMDKKGGEVFSKLIADLNGDVSKMAEPHGPDEDGVFRPPVRSDKKDPRIPPKKKGRQPIPPRPKEQLLR